MNDPIRQTPPTSLNRPARLNRTLLALLGTAMIAAGGFALATHFGRLTILHPNATLAPGTSKPPTWALYITAAAAVIVGLACLRWIAAQLIHRPRAQTWRLESDIATGRTELGTTTAIAPFVDEVKTYPGVHNATATLSGTRLSPAVALVISAEQDGDLAEIRHRLDDHGLPRLRQALDLTAPRVTVEFRFNSAS
jgi:hypothetical protein